MNVFMWVFTHISLKHFAQLSFIGRRRLRRYSSFRRSVATDEGNPGELNLLRSEWVKETRSVSAVRTRMERMWQEGQESVVDGLAAGVSAMPTADCVTNLRHPLLCPFNSFASDDADFVCRGTLSLPRLLFRRGKVCKREAGILGTAWPMWSWRLSELILA